MKYITSNCFNMKQLIMPTLFMVTLLFVACKKELGDKLPPLTFEGKNTFGCKIDGVSWTPKGYHDLGIGYWVPPTGGGLYQEYTNSKFDIYFSANSLWTSMVIYLKNNGTSNYPLARIYNLNEVGCFAGFRSTGGLYSDYIRSGWVELLKVDTVNSIVSGRFEFDAFNYVNSTENKITEGRFDFKTH